MVATRITRQRPPGARDLRAVRGEYNVMAYGAKGDGVADDTAAIAAAIAAAGVAAGGATGGATVVFPPPPAYYKIVAGNIPITWPGIRFVGDRYTQIINTGVNDLFLLGTAIAGVTNLDFRGLYITNQLNAGHIFNVQLGMSKSNFSEMLLSQRNPDKSILYMSSAGSYISNHVEYCDLYMRAYATVPGWYIRCSSGGLNANGFRKSTFSQVGASAALGSGFPCIYFESTNLTNFCYDNRFEDIVFEVISGGCIWIYSGQGNLIDNCTVYDTPAGGTTNHMFILDKTAGGLAGKWNKLRDVKRRGGTLGVGMKDIKLGGAAAPATVIESCRDTVGTSFVVDCGFNLVSILEMAGVTLQNLNDRSTLVLDSGGGFGAAPAKLQWGAGAAVLYGSGSPEGVITATVGSLWLRSDGAVGTTLYRKNSGTGNTGWAPDALVGSATWNPASLADGATASTTVTVTGAVQGDVAVASHGALTVAGAILFAHVTAADTVTVTLVNHTGGAFDLASGTLRVRVMKAA